MRKIECHTCFKEIKYTDEFGIFCSLECKETRNKRMYELAKQLDEIDPIKPVFTEREEAYRRGFCHGFLALQRNPELTQQEVYAWRHGNQTVAPPGSFLDGQHLHGLTVEDPHRFFMDKLKAAIKKTKEEE